MFCENHAAIRQYYIIEKTIATDIIVIIHEIQFQTSAWSV